MEYIYIYIYIYIIFRDCVNQSDKFPFLFIFVTGKYDVGVLANVGCFCIGRFRLLLDTTLNIHFFEMFYHLESIIVGNGYERIFSYKRTHDCFQTTVYLHLLPTLHTSAAGPRCGEEYHICTCHTL